MIAVWAYLFGDTQIDHAWAHRDGSVDVINIVNFFEPIHFDDYGIFLRHSSSRKAGAGSSCQEGQLLTIQDFDDSNQFFRISRIDDAHWQLCVKCQSIAAIGVERDLVILNPLAAANLR